MVYKDYLIKLLLDTSVYGRIIEEKKDILLKEKIDGSKKVVVYGNDIVRRELEETPYNLPKDLPEVMQLKNRLISLYDFLIKDHSLKITGLISYLAEKYRGNCKKIPKVNQNKIYKDFLIVACASFYGLDIVVSEDKRTMLSEEAQKAYKKVNQEEGLRTPKFIGLTAFEEIIKL